MAFLANLSVFSYIFSGSGDEFQLVKDVGVLNDVLPSFFFLLFGQFCWLFETHILDFEGQGFQIV